MKLYIAEKPSLARAVADALPPPHTRKEGYIQVANGDKVTWCIGHLLEQAPPDSYNSDYKKWQIVHLPIIPEQWKLLPKTSTQKQLNIVVSLIKQAEEIIHTGDPDREGQLLIDEVLNYSQLPAEKLKQVKRCLISDLNIEAVKKAIQQQKENSEFIPLSTSALARARADWLYGINMSRLCTVKGQQQGYQGVLSVGRVQTPLLGLIVRRDIEIEQFTAKPFYEVFAHLLTEYNEIFKAKWQPSEECTPYQNEEGRVLLKALAENVIARISGKEGTIDSVSRKKRELAPPLPFNLSTLQIEMARKFGLSAQNVLDICQQLYEKYKLITYPRSDCRYLPTEHLSQIEAVTQAIVHNCQNFTDKLTRANLNLRTKCWDDDKVGAHHAIIPTARKVNFDALSLPLQQVYAAICLQYIGQFYPVYRFIEQQIVVDILSGKFIAKTNQQQDLGWKVLFGKNEIPTEDDGVMAVLHALVKGDKVNCVNAELIEKQTQPPKPFTDATLISAMTGIARFVNDQAIKKVLRETDGLGTEATRAGIIELLFKRQFIQRKGRQIIATPAGRQFILHLPSVITTPDMTALWESQLEEISHKSMRYQEFMTQLYQFLSQLIEQVKQQSFSQLAKIQAIDKQ